LTSSGGSKDVEAKGSHYICERKERDGLTVEASGYPAQAGPTVACQNALRLQQVRLTTVCRAFSCGAFYLFL